MARRKKVRKKVKIEHLIESEAYEEIEFTDPNTGEKKTQKVKITRYKTKAVAPTVGEDEVNEVIDRINSSINAPMIDVDA